MCQGKSYTELLQSLGLFSLENRLRGDLTAVYSSSQGEAQGIDLFLLLISNRTRGNGLRLCQGRFKLDIRERFFTEGDGALPVRGQDAFGCVSQAQECDLGFVPCRARSWT